MFTSLSLLALVASAFLSGTTATLYTSYSPKTYPDSFNSIDKSFSVNGEIPVAIKSYNTAPVSTVTNTVAKVATPTNTVLQAHVDAPHLPCKKPHVLETPKFFVAASHQKPTEIYAAPAVRNIFWSPVPQYGDLTALATLNIGSNAVPKHLTYDDAYFDALNTLNAFNAINIGNERYSAYPYALQYANPNQQIRFELPGAAAEYQTLHKRETKQK